MSFRDALAALIVPNRDLIERAAEDFAAQVTPPPRSDAGPVLDRDAVTIPAVYRALQLLATAASQLPLTVERQGRRIDSTRIPALIRRPSLDMSRSDWIEQTVTSLAVSGNAFWKHERPGRETLALTVLNPHEVAVIRDPRTGRITYSHKGETYTHDEMSHLHLMRLPGALRGVGPIQAAQQTMRASVDMRDHMAGWFSDTGQPAGILSTEQALTSEDAARARRAWNHLDDDGNAITDRTNPSRVRVLGKGTTYQPILISPKDALWLDAQSFTVLEVARLFGVPSSLMLAAIEGNSQTYSNVEQEWLAFARFTLVGYLRKIEEALTEVSANGQTVRFNLDALLRSDTRSRYEAHEIGLRAGFLTLDEVRGIEDLGPLPPGHTPPASAQQPPSTQESTA